MKALDCEQLFWRYLSHVKPFPPGDVRGGSLCMVAAGWSEGYPSKRCGKPRPAGASTQSSLQSGRMLVCPTILVSVRTQV